MSEPRPAPEPPGPTEHDLKTWPACFAAVADGRKTFEVRKNDRAFQAGDVLNLREWDPYAAEAYSGRALRVPVLWVLPGGEFGIARGHVAMSLGPVIEAIGFAQPAAAAPGWAPHLKGKCRDCGTFRRVDRDNRCRVCVVGEDPSVTPRDSLDAAIAAERGADRPCADTLAYLEGLRAEPDVVIAEALAQFSGGAE